MYLKCKSCGTEFEGTMLFLEAQVPTSAQRKNDDPVARVQDIGEVCPVCHNVRLYDKADYFSH